MLHRLTVCILAGGMLAGAAGCSKGAGGQVPTSIPVTTFVAPEEDEVFPDADDEDDDGDTAATTADKD
ncbi:MAG TPA: hypothetical protein VM734_31125 [Kofleriaceae bacterium]|jgi:hypothetical protein|nr:hypothetical protein [Kofleriaceae bacterium]